MGTKEIGPEAGLFELLTRWCEALAENQLNLPGKPEYDGGILCPACKMIHGRCHEAAYPLMLVAKKTGDEKYLTAAKKLFSWGENLLGTDGSMRNDVKSQWKGTTVFAAAALHDALFFHGGLLDSREREEWEERLSGMGEWLYHNLRPERTKAYINYYASNACAMAKLGNHFGKEEYLTLAKELAGYCFSHVSENGLVYGEGSPNGKKSAKGCFAFDIGGYNAEETLPMLTKYAAAAKDGEALDKCRELWRAQLEWMLPDGAWDDSTGTRAFKWTYWGSRTTDGCQDALFYLGGKDPVFAEAALRNFTLLESCTHKGLLYGGPDYYAHGEKACVHHTFCHAKALAGALDEGLYPFERQTLPSDAASGIEYYKELDACRVFSGSWIADITGYDFRYMAGDHASGGAISLLWHKKCGPLIASGALGFTLKEPNNQQLPSFPEKNLCVCPRVEAVRDGKRFSQHYDRAARLTAKEAKGWIKAAVKADLCDEDGVPCGGKCVLGYLFTENELIINGTVFPGEAKEARFILPLIGDKAKVSVGKGSLSAARKEFFNVNPGFSGYEYTVLPDKDGEFSISVKVM
ncbi:MAG: hypothetical protein IJS90_05830 [Clostridia bacterium]|nr:hypothetical protein [Clostridia bacterium]